MNKSYIAFLLLLLTYFKGDTQTTYKEGFYKSHQEILDNAPSFFDSSLTMSERTPGEIQMNGGNAYKLKSSDKSVKRRVLKKEILAYSDGKDFYINCQPHKIQTWYAKIEDFGKYYLFFGCMTNGQASTRAIGGGLAGGAIGGMVMGMSAAGRSYVYALDIKTNKVFQVNKKKLLYLLSNYPELKTKYESEGKMKDPGTIFSYMKQIN